MAKAKIIQTLAAVAKKDGKEGKPICCAKTQT